MKVEIGDILKKHAGAGRDALIPVLQEVQESCGYLSRDSVIQIGRALNLPASKIYGVATFYNQFRFHAPGKHIVQVCRGTACHVKRSLGVLDAARRALKIEPGETTRDGLFTLEVVACMGACGLAPVIRVDDEFYAGMTADNVKKIFDSYRRKEAAHE